MSKGPLGHRWKGEKSAKGIRLVLTVLFWLVVIGLVAALWIGWIEPRMVRTRRYTVQVPHLGAPLRAVVIGDLQPNEYHWPAARLSALFRRLQDNEQPDLVLWLGDFYNAPTDMMKVVLEDNPRMNAWIDARLPSMDEIADAMTQLRGRLGDFAVLGNHDWAWSGAETEAALTARGVTVLKDEIANVHCEDSGTRLQIVGYEDVSSGRTPAYERMHGEMDAATASVALAHSPDTFKFAEGGPTLMLSGHTHGGQVRLPGIGPLLLPLNHTRYDRGWFGDGARRLLVTTGLGTSLPPVRLLCPPEVTVLELVPETPGEL